MLHFNRIILHIQCNFLLMNTYLIVLQLYNNIYKFENIVIDTEMPHH